MNQNLGPSFTLTPISTYATPLQIAVDNGQVQVVEQLLSNGAYVDAISYRNCYTPLYHAVRKGNETLTMLLLSRGANVNITHDHGETALHVAAKTGRLPIVLHLLNHGADVNSAYTDTCQKGFTALHLAVQYGNDEIIKLLLSRGAHTNCIHHDGETPLHLAAMLGHLQIAEHLLNYGADLTSSFTSSSLEGFRPLHCAVLIGNEPITKLFLSRGASVHCTTHNGKTPLHIAAKKGNITIVEHLLKCGADLNSVYRSQSSRGFTPLHCAATVGHEEIVKLLLSRGAHANCFSYEGETALHIAALKGYVQIVEQLVNHGVDVNAAYPFLGMKKGPTPLFLAAKEGHADVIKLLVLYKADINAKSIDGCTALDVAESRHRNARSVMDQRKYSLAVEALLKCEKEIERMKNDMIGNSYISFYDILTLSVNQLATYARNEEIEEIIKSCYFKTYYPLYVDMIRARFKKGVQRKELLQQCGILFHIHFKHFRGLPQISVEQILINLSDENLKNLLLACHVNYR